MSDEEGNVRGTYTIPDTDGKPILVNILVYVLVMANMLVNNGYTYG